MPTPKKAKLPPVPKPRKGKAAPSPSPQRGEGTGERADAGPDLSMIAEALRPLAVPVGGLLFDPANARTHDERNLEAIRGSLAAYGQVKPVVARRNPHDADHVDPVGVVIAGNGTLQAALSLGWTHLAVVWVNFTDAKAAGFSIADNRTAELAGWDRAALDALLRDCDTGNDEVLDAMLSDLATEVGVVPAEPKEPKAKADPSETQPARIVCPACQHEFDGTIRVTEADPNRPRD